MQFVFRIQEIKKYSHIKSIEDKQMKTERTCQVNEELTAKEIDQEIWEIESSYYKGWKLNEIEIRRVFSIDDYERWHDLMTMKKEQAID